MIELIFVSQEIYPTPLRNRDWYQKISRIIRSIIPVWIEMDTSIIFLDESEMRRVNRRHHHQDRVTDVLSFFYPQTPTEKNIGELYVCIAQINRQAKRYKTNFLAEYVRVVVHGLLHLQGYDHMKTPERKRMNLLATDIALQIKKKRLC